MSRVKNKAMLRAQEAVDAFVQGIQNDAEKLKDHLAGICFPGNQDELKIQVRSAFDVEYNLTGDTEATSELLVALGLKEEDFVDEE